MPKQTGFRRASPFAFFPLRERRRQLIKNTDRPSVGKAGPRFWSCVHIIHRLHENGCSVLWVHLPELGVEYPRSRHRPGVSRLIAAYPEGRSTTGIVALRGSKPPHSNEWFLHGPHVPATDAALGDRLTLWTTAGYPGDVRKRKRSRSNYEFLNFE